MADAVLRALERAAHGGDHAARAKLLQERLRAGRLGRERLALAAALGDEAARALAGALEPDGDDAHAFLTRIELYGPEVAARLAVPLAREALALVGQVDERDRAALTAAERWLDAPGPERATACRRALLRATRALEVTASLERAVGEACLAAAAIVGGRTLVPPRQRRFELVALLNRLEPDLACVEDRLRALARGLAPWALGEGAPTVPPPTELDALRERVRFPRPGRPSRLPARRSRSRLRGLWQAVRGD